ncbi:MAG: NfeD family protein [Balneolaceae bacterium]|nr:NfeD family protein [Balneolaceae bacterium]MBO6547330.1 NfeD family protein [Balneolaceae bacterium]MBO6647723.1 NfeD family protein [Balneolaceae bacterium]
MDGETLTWIFLIGGIVLMALEWVIPSGMSVILGFSGLLVGLIRFLGFLDDPITATLAWFIISSVLTIATLPFLKKYFGGESSFKVADEDFEAMDQIVDVVEPIDDLTSEGRIRFQGISWQARSMEGEIPAGTQVRIVYRDNTTWIVEPVGKLDEPDTQRLKQKN